MCDATEFTSAIVIVLRTNTKCGTFTTIDTYILKVAKFRELVISALDNHKRVADSLHLVAVESGEEEFYEGIGSALSQTSHYRPSGMAIYLGHKPIDLVLSPKNTKCI